MYIQLKNIHKSTITRGDGQTFPALKVGLCWLYKDDDKNIKFVEMTDVIIEKLLNAKIEITIPELEGLLKEHEIEKLLPPKESTLFDHVPLKWF